jgi:hypothetical protein
VLDVEAADDLDLRPLATRPALGASMLLHAPHFAALLNLVVPISCGDDGERGSITSILEILVDRW